MTTLGGNNKYTNYFLQNIFWGINVTTALWTGKLLKVLHVFDVAQVVCFIFSLEWKLSSHRYAVGVVMFCFIFSRSPTFSFVFAVGSIRIRKKRKGRNYWKLRCIFVVHGHFRTKRKFFLVFLSFFVVVDFPRMSISILCFCPLLKRTNSKAGCICMVKLTKHQINA